MVLCSNFLFLNVGNCRKAVHQTKKCLLGIWSGGCCFAVCGLGGRSLLSSACSSSAPGRPHTLPPATLLLSLVWPFLTHPPTSALTSKHVLQEHLPSPLSPPCWPPMGGPRALCCHSTSWSHANLLCCLVYPSPTHTLSVRLCTIHLYMPGT